MHILIFTPDEAKLGQKMRISCYPICANIMKNNSVFLNHIVICHYWSSFSCGKCLKFVVSSGQQMKKHFLKCYCIRDAHEKTHLQGSRSSKSRGCGKSSSKPKKNKKDKCDKCGEEGKGDKPHRSESKSSSKTASQEQVQESLHHSQCIPGSNAEGSHHKSHKKLMKHGKKSHKSHKKSHQLMWEHSISSLISYCSVVFNKVHREPLLAVCVCFAF